MRYADWKRAESKVHATFRSELDAAKGARYQIEAHEAKEIRNLELTALARQYAPWRTNATITRYVGRA